MADAPPRGSWRAWSRRRWAIPVYLALGAVVFVMFLAASFPYNTAMSSLLAPYGLRLSYRDQRMNVPLGAELDQVELTSLRDPGGQVLLQSPAVTLAPTLASLLLGRPGLRIHARLFGGTARAIVHQKAGTVELTFDLDGIDLAASPPLPELGANLGGIVTGAGSAIVAGPAVTQSRGQLELVANDFAVAPTNGFPAVHFGIVNLTLRIADGVVTVARLENHGGDLEMTGGGVIRLAPNLPDSVLDLRLILQPTASGRARFGFFLNLLPHPPGPHAPYTITGELRAPHIS